MKTIETGRKTAAGAIEKTKRIGVAWYRRKRVSFISARLSGEGVEWIHHVLKNRRQKYVNILLLPNLMFKKHKDQPPLLIWCPYFAQPQETKARPNATNLMGTKFERRSKARTPHPVIAKFLTGRKNEKAGK